MEPISPNQPGESPETSSTASQRDKMARHLMEILSTPSDQLSDNGRAFVGDMLIAHLTFLPESKSAEISRQLAGGLAPPPALLRRFLTGPLSAATPMLASLSWIPDGLLVEASQVSTGHAKAIAARPAMSDLVAAALLDQEDATLVSLILTRDDILIGAGQVDRLVARSREEPGIRHRLIERKELQPSHAFNMFWWLERRDRKRVLQRFSMDRNVIQDALAPLFLEVFTDDDPDPLVKSLLTLCDRRHRPRSKNGEVLPMASVEQFLRAARTKPTDELCAAAGLLAGVSARTAKRLLLDPLGEPFAILCKSLGLGRRAFAQLMDDAQFRRRDGAIGPSFDAEACEALSESFDSIARDYSRTILRYWDWQDALMAMSEGEHSSKAAETAA